MLGKALTGCPASDVSTQMKVLHEEVDVQEISTRVNQGLGSMYEKPVSSEKKTKCERCGYWNNPRKCTTYGKTCKTCEKKNHFTKMCWASSQKKSLKVHAVESN